MLKSVNAPIERHLVGQIATYRTVSIDRPPLELRPDPRVFDSEGRVQYTGFLEQDSLVLIVAQVCDGSTWWTLVLGPHGVLGWTSQAARLRLFRPNCESDARNVVR